MVTLNKIFSDGIILQASKPIRFFGEGNGTVEITLFGNTKTTNSNGKWLIEFDKRDYQNESFDILFKLDGEEYKISAYLGDVYLLCGQSNMQFKLWESSEPAENYIDNENIRLYTVDRMEEGERFLSSHGWVKCTKENAPHFSAIGYYIGQALSREHKIGLISMYQGASAIQSWMPKYVASKYPVSKAILEYPIWNDNAVLFEHMTKTILPFSISHVLWYQGESNSFVGEAELYSKMLYDMINSWRSEFCDSNLPFVVIQIADCDWRNDEPWRAIQREQLKIVDMINNVWVVRSNDVCESDDIHPKTKSVLCKRIVDAILS